MSDQNNIIEAKVRDTKKKSELNKLRSDGFVPGILYGDIEKNISLSIKKTTLDHFLKTTNFKSKVVKITLEGKEFEVLPRDVEFDNLSNQPIHVDFQKLSANTKVIVWIPVKFLNEETCPGLKMGGVLNIVRRKIELDCPADKIPSELIVDLAEKEIGETIRISAIKLPEGVIPTIKDRDFTIATVAAPTVVKEPEPAAEAEAASTTEGGDEAKTDDAKADGTDKASNDKEKKESADKK
jgi:large subunit ribosomal protein L25